MVVGIPVGDMVAFQVIILFYKIYHPWSIIISSNYLVIVAFQLIISSNKYFVFQNISSMI